MGSGCPDVRHYECAIEASRNVFNEAQILGYQLRILDIGGGFHGQLNPDVPFKKLATAIKNSLTKHFPPDLGVRIISEPGQYVVRSAFTLLTDIIGKRVSSKEGEAAESFNHILPLSPPAWRGIVPLRVVGSRLWGTHVSETAGRTYSIRSLNNCLDLRLCNFMVICPFAPYELPHGETLAKSGTTRVQTLRNTYLWNWWMDLHRSNFYVII